MCNTKWRTLETVLKIYKARPFLVNHPFFAMLEFRFAFLIFFLDFLDRFDLLLSSAWLRAPIATASSSPPLSDYFSYFLLLLYDCTYPAGAISCCFFIPPVTISSQSAFGTSSALEPLFCSVSSYLDGFIFPSSLASPSSSGTLSVNVPPLFRRVSFSTTHFIIVHLHHLELLSLCSC